MEYDFQTLERIVREVHHLGEITSLSSTPLRMTKNDENNEIDLSPAYVPFSSRKYCQNEKASPYKHLHLNRHQFRELGLIIVK